MSSSITQRVVLNQGWQFRRLRPGLATSWTDVELPHTPFVADLDGRELWFGECEYRRTLQLPPLENDGRHVLFVGAAMHTAHVFVDDREVAHHVDGYLPFEVDLTEALQPNGQTRTLTLRLDNRDNPDVPPGKPHDNLDFCWYGGLYRGMELRIKPALHITDAIAAGEIAGGGVFLRTLEASVDSAVVAAKTHLRNTSATDRRAKVRTALQYRGVEVAVAVSELVSVPAGASVHVEQQLTLPQPQLWSPASPSLYDVTSTMVDPQGAEVDSQHHRFGIRRISFSKSGGFTINGQRLRLRGTNRHQEFPRVGYAAPRAAQYRDARRIKEAGFDYVRLAHYPQSPEFLDACDELGIVAMNCIPGWQFLGGELFRALCYDNARQLIRRDRNHPCVVLWELSLNETHMDEAFMSRLHAIGHEEYPGDQMFTCGWLDRFDIFTHSRQHGEIHRWVSGDKAMVIAEYVDWEFFARNDGFDQKTGAGLFDRWSTGRQFRSDGERGLRQQAFNHMIALNDTLASPAVLDGQWAIFDYARGYDPVRAAAGIMDVFRLPKFSYYFYQSQRDPDDRGHGWAVGAMVFIASHWTAVSNLRLPVFSNCEEVELRLDGRPLARLRAAQTALSQHLPHPPFFFDLPRFTPGRLEAIGYIGGRPHASHAVATPASATHLELVVDDLGVARSAGESDLLLAHARWCDAAGTLCIDEIASVVFSIEGTAELVGPTSLAAEAGIASVVIRVPADSSGFTLRATPVAYPLVGDAAITWPLVDDVCSPVQPLVAALVSQHS